MLTTTNAALHETRTEHSLRDGQVTRSVDPNGLASIQTHDVFGKLTQVQYRDAVDGQLLPARTISYTRCSGGDPSTCAGGYGEDANQDWAAWRVTEVQDGYPTVVSWHDLLGRKIKRAERGFGGSLVAQLTEYDADGNTNQVSTPYFTGGTAWFTGWSYDRIGRPIEKISPGAELDPAHGNVKTTYTYAANKTTIKVRGQNVSATCSVSTNLCMDMTRTYDVLGRLQQTTQNNGPVVNYAVTDYWYDGRGNPVAARDAEGNVIRAGYDDSGRRTVLVDPDAGTSSYTYNALGEPLTSTDARGIVTSNTHDALGRLVQRTVTDANASDPSLKVIRDTWNYDPTGSAGGDGVLGSARRETGATVAGLTQIWRENYSYESATKRLQATTSTLDGQAPWTTEFRYNTAGREDKVTYPSGFSVLKRYTIFGDLSELDNSTVAQNYWKVTGKDAYGNTTGESYIGGIVGTHTSYASTGQSRQKGWSTAAGLLDQWDYDYDSFGNLARQARSGTVAATSWETYQYDGLQRLIETVRPQPPNANCSAQPELCPPIVRYTYTPSGNLDSKSDYSKSVAGAYIYGRYGCGPHAVSAVQPILSTARIHTYTCDASGNVIGGSQLTAGLYDFQNLPWHIARAGAGEAWFAYDANGNRFREQATSHTTWFGPRGFERTQTGSQTTDRHELGPITVERVGGVDTIHANLRDRLGSTVAMTDGGATVTSIRAYDAFGKVRGNLFVERPNGTLDLQPDTLRGFTGHEHVDDVRLIHMNGRMYDYQLGRFLSVDPVIQFPTNTQSLNPYSYILNNPLSGRDPSGYQACTGSHIDRNDGSSCAGQGVKGGGSNSPDPMQQLNAKGMATQVRTWNQHVDAMTVKGSTSTPSSGNQADIGANGKTVGSAPGNERDTHTLESVKVTAKAGAYLNADEEASVRRLSYNDIQAGKDPRSETLVFIDAKGKILERTQSGCRGGDDACSGVPPIGTTIVGHSHVYPTIPSGVDPRTRQIKELSRDMPGRGDAGSLRQGVPGAVWTPGGYKFAIEGTFQNPTVRYLEGGQPSFGHYVEQHWRPNDNQLLFNIATDYIRDNSR